MSRTELKKVVTNTREPSILELRTSRGAKHPTGDEMLNITFNGNYFFLENYSFQEKIFWFFDLLLSGFVYITLGFIFSYLLNKFTIKELDRSQSKVQVAFEATGQGLLIILVLYFIIQLAPRIIIPISYEAPIEHHIFKSYSGGILLIFSLLAAEDKLRDKLQYVFDTKESNEKLTSEQVNSYWRENGPWS